MVARVRIPLGAPRRSSPNCFRSRDLRHCEQRPLAGLIGCGRIAERVYILAMARVPGVRLAAVADPVLDRCERAAPGVPAFTSAAELIGARVVDALVLLTPAAVHLADARLAANAGLPTLVEKPPASTLAEAFELARLERRRDSPSIAAWSPSSRVCGARFLRHPGSSSRSSCARAHLRGARTRLKMTSSWTSAHTSSISSAG